LFAEKKKTGWLAFELAEGMVSMAYVVPANGRRPSVELCGTYRCEGGELNTLRRLRKSLRLDGFRCTLCLSFGDYQFLQAEAPDVPDEEMLEALRWRLKDMVDFPVDQSTLDAIDIISDKGGKAKARAKYVALSPNETIERYVRLFQDAGLDLQVIDIPEMAQRNLAALFETQDRAVAMLSFSKGGGLLTFTYKSELLSSRHIDISLQQLTDAEGSLRDAMFDRIGLELQRSLDSFERQATFVSLDKLVVMPLDENIGLTAYLAENMYVGVLGANLGEVLDIQKTPELRQPSLQAQRMMLIGVALRSEAAA
jgi:MSHA biogenesis protein MshI